MADFGVNGISERVTNISAQTAQEINKQLSEKQVHEVPERQNRTSDVSDGKDINVKIVEQAAKELESVANSLNTELRFEISDSGDMVVNVIDSNGEVVRSVPPQEIVRFRETIANSIAVLGRENSISSDQLGSMLIDESI